MNLALLGSSSQVEAIWGEGEGGSLHTMLMQHLQQGAVRSTPDANARIVGCGGQQRSVGRVLNVIDAENVVRENRLGDPGRCVQQPEVGEADKR